MAADITRATGEPARIQVGGRGEFTVWVGDRVVAEKSGDRFPTSEECVTAVRAALTP